MNSSETVLNQSLKHNFSNPAHRKDFFDKFGGEEHVRQTYPAVFNAVVKSMNRVINTDPLFNNTLCLAPPGIIPAAVNRSTGDSLKAGTAFDLVSQATCHFPKGMKYIFMKGELKDNNGKPYDSFADEFELTDQKSLYDADGILSAYMPDMIRMNDMAYHCTGNAYAVDAQGHIERLEERRTVPVVVSGGTSIVKELSISAPIYTNTQKSNNIIMLYGRDPFQDEKQTWDYLWANNIARNNRVNTLVPVSGTIIVKDNYVINSVADVGYTLELLYEGAGEPVVSYNYPQSSISEAFTFADNKKSCTFCFKENWNCPLDLSLYDSSNCRQKLHVYFYLNVTNTKTQNTELISIIINSTDNKSRPHFKVEGTTVYVPYLAIRWGCLAAGTLITMCDGTIKPVEAVTPGEMVQTPAGSARVCNVFSGLEEMMIRILTEEGHELLASRTHPIHTTEGIKRAADLAPGIHILTYNGTTEKIRFAHECEYSGMVYNLELSDDADAMLANGFVVGDFTAQNNLPITNVKDTPITPEAVEVISQFKQMIRDFNLI